VRSRRSNKIRCQSPIVVVVVVVVAAAAVVVVVVVFYRKVLVLVLELAGIIRHKRKPIETKTCQKDFPLCDQPDPQLQNNLDF